jgi:predicted RNase H-like HicB family nuclease
VIVERDPETGLFVGSVPGWPGAHSQGATQDELDKNLREVLAMLLEEGGPKLKSEIGQSAQRQLVLCTGVNYSCAT